MNNCIYLFVTLLVTEGQLEISTLRAEDFACFIDSVCFVDFLYFH